MASKTNIEWTDYNWNFLRGCSRVSSGCVNCYAESVAARFSGIDDKGKKLPYFGLAQMVNGKPRWTGEISFHEDILMEPLRWKKPRKVFVNSMSDLFHEKVTDEMLDKAFAVMALTPQHTYQILTKRPERMKAYFNGEARARIASRAWANDHRLRKTPVDFIAKDSPMPWPLPNVWLGVSVEDQKTADERIPLLLETPAAVRWISAEPLLGPIELHNYFYTRYEMSGLHHETEKLDWVVVGGESGPGARPFDIQWARDIIAQCKAAGVPVFVKQLGANFIDAENGIGGFQTKTPEEYGPLHRRLKSKKGGDMSEWPENLRIREFPTRVA